MTHLHGPCICNTVLGTDGATFRTLYVWEMASKGFILQISLFSAVLVVFLGLIASSRCFTKATIYITICSTDLILYNSSWTKQDIRFKLFWNIKMLYSTNVRELFIFDKMIKPVLYPTSVPTSTMLTLANCITLWSEGRLFQPFEYFMSYILLDYCAIKRCISVFPKTVASWAISRAGVLCMTRTCPYLYLCY